VELFGQFGDLVGERGGHDVGGVTVGERDQHHEPKH
jgi:hypothetical protein